MNRLKVVRVLLLLLMLAGVFLMLADPVHAIVHFVSNAIPPALLLSLWLGAPATRREKKEFDEERKQKLEAARDGHRVRIDSDGNLQRAGVLSVSELRERRDKAWLEAKELITGNQLVFNAKITEVKVLDERIRALEKKVKAYRPQVPPAEQLGQLSNQYDLPVLTPLQKNQLPVLHIDPAVRALVSDEELADARRRFEESLGKPVVVLPPGVPAALGAAVSTAEFAENLKAFQESVHAAKAELEYVPAGQAELSNDLMECLARQVDEANRTRWSAGRKREWHISPEWLEEVRKLKSGGKPVWRPRQREECDPLPGYLLGYPVVVADHFGIPELTAV